MHHDWLRDQFIIGEHDHGVATIKRHVELRINAREATTVTNNWLVAGPSKDEPVAIPIAGSLALYPVGQQQLGGNGGQELICTQCAIKLQ